MDPLTHALSGSVLARALPGKPLPTRYVMLLVLLTMAPDADFVLHYISDTTYLQYHRGVTHSLLMLPLWTWLIYSLLPARRASFIAHPTRLPAWLIAAAIAMVGVAFVLIVLFRKYRFAASERRMRSMLECVGLDPSIAESGDTEAIMKEVRQRCRTCATEDVCDRWLVGQKMAITPFVPTQ
ncbi:MAG: metal-dependent hydrolase [Mariprofundaceae bacterium]|nr:metal-dependent hydrolase [Mariprofundaceae bacterium]